MTLAQLLMAELGSHISKLCTLLFYLNYAFIKSFCTQLNKVNIFLISVVCSQTVDLHSRALIIWINCISPRRLSFKGSCIEVQLFYLVLLGLPCHELHAYLCLLMINFYSLICFCVFGSDTNPTISLFCHLHSLIEVKEMRVDV